MPTLEALIYSVQRRAHLVCDVRYLLFGRLYSRATRNLNECRAHFSRTAAVDMCCWYALDCTRFSGSTEHLTFFFAAAASADHFIQLPLYATQATELHQLRPSIVARRYASVLGTNVLPCPKNVPVQHGKHRDFFFIAPSIYFYMYVHVTSSESSLHTYHMIPCDIIIFCRVPCPLCM